MSNGNKKSGDGFATGMILILIGIFAVCVTFFDVHIVWSEMLKLWPLLLIIIGICVLPINRWIRTVLVVAILIGGFFGYRSMVKNDCYEEIETTSTYYGDWDTYDETVVEQD